MKKSLLLFACSAMLTSLIVMQNKPHKNSTATKAKLMHAEASDEDVNTRNEYELSRLADPATGKIPAQIHQREMAFAATLPNDALRANAKLSSTLTWDFRGPWNVGGRTRAFAIDVTNENILLAGGVSGGMWRSTDGGVTWTRVSSVNEHPDVIAIAQDKRAGHTNTWYYLSGEAYGTSASGGSAFFLGNGMYKSTDGGLTWNSLANTVSGTPQFFDNNFDAAWNVVTDPHDTINDVVYAATLGGVFKSNNGGTTWSLIKGSTNNTAPYYNDVAVTTTGVMYATLSSDGAATVRGIWRCDNGTTYTKITPPNYPAAYNRMVIGIDPNDENTVYFFGLTPGFGKHSTDYTGADLWNSLWKYQYLSGNGTGTGGVWTDLSQNMPGNINQFNGLNTQGGYDLVVKVKPGNSNILFIGGTSIYRSNSGFTDSTSTEVIGGYEIGAALPFVNEYPGHHPDQHGLTFLPSNPDVMFSNSDGGISKTIDNTATPLVWNELNNGYITSQFYTITMDHATTNDIIMGGLQDNGTYYTNNTNQQSAWVHSFDGDGSYCAIADGGSNYYFSKQQGRVAKTTVDANGNVTAYRRIDPIGATGYSFINPFVLDPNNQNIMYMPAGKRMWRNDDLSGIALSNQWDTISTNWTMLPDSLPLSTEQIVSLAVSKVPAHRIYYGTKAKKVFKIDNANTGLPSAVAITGTTFPTGYVSCIAVDPTNADHILVVFSNYNIYSLFYSENAGTTWIKVAGNLEQNASGTGTGPSCRWASIIPVSNGTVYLVGTSTGLYATDTMINNATQWVQQGTNSIGSNIVDMIDYRTNDGLVVVATHGNGVFSTHITSVNDITTVNDLADAGIEMNVYPNPTTNELNLVLKNSSTKNLKISIVNELGIKVKTVDASRLSGGTMKIDVADLRNGMYYINVEDRKRRFAKAFLKM